MGRTFHPPRGFHHHLYIFNFQNNHLFLVSLAFSQGSNVIVCQDTLNSFQARVRSSLSSFLKLYFSNFSCAINTLSQDPQTYVRFFPPSLSVYPFTPPAKFFLEYNGLMSVATGTIFKALITLHLY